MKDNNSVFLSLHYGFGSKGFRTKEVQDIHNASFYQSGKFIDYITRENAVLVQSKNENLVNKINEHKNLSSKTIWWNQQTKRNKSPKFSGLCKLFSNQINVDISEAKKQMEKITDKQHIWEMVISAGELALNNNFVDTRQYQNLVNSGMQKLLKSNGINFESIKGFWAIHANTNQPHLHLAFWEEEKTFDNGTSFRKKGNFDKETMKKFREYFYENISNNDEYLKLNDDKANVWKQKNIVKQSLINALQNNKSKIIIDTQSKLIWKELKGKKDISYQRQSDEIKKMTSDIFLALSSTNEKLKEDFSDYIKFGNELEIKPRDSNNIKTLKQDAVDKEADEFERAIGNTILKAIVEQNQENINSNDDDVILSNYWIGGLGNNLQDKLIKELLWILELENKKNQFLRNKKIRTKKFN
ncbi:hypothetical protein [[Mycoplasma] gypis]|uniref:Uncharacterized protein n=1 Tax=[Mycoplasma] gypis TaxID=92404 RepID=A0ABZ2RR68_9BACT|nr:hypothetical protein [[Mycoplasma] gypis]MBN0919399.1 hypothetical protein [[Mycoplasma] gypis]